MFPSARLFPSGRQTDPSDYTIRVSTCQEEFLIVRLILPHRKTFVNPFFVICENFSVWIPSAPSERSTFWGLCQVKSSSSKKFFCQVEYENFFENFSEIFVPTGPGRFCQVLFLRSSKKKKKHSPYIIPHFGAFVKRFLRKTFFIFREKLLDFTPHIYYNIYIR